MRKTTIDLNSDGISDIIAAYYGKKILKAEIGLRLYPSSNHEQVIQDVKIQPNLKEPSLQSQTNSTKDPIINLKSLVIKNESLTPLGFVLILIVCISLVLLSKFAGDKIHRLRLMNQYLNEPENIGELRNYIKKCIALGISKQKIIESCMKVG
jgi:hypothetical protein